jgi:hypothetical protein
MVEEYELNKTLHFSPLWFFKIIKILTIELLDASLKQSTNIRPIRLAYQPSPTILFSQNKPATNHQPAILFSQNKSASTRCYPAR